jgi:O-methyltransferase
MGPSVLEHNFDKRGLVRPFIHKGWFGHISDYPDPIAFAFLDGDFYDSIMDGLRALWPRLSPGAFLAVHDVYHPGLPGVLRALDDFRVGNDFTLEQTHADGIHYLRKGGQPVIHTP